MLDVRDSWDSPRCSRTISRVQTSGLQGMITVVKRPPESVQDLPAFWGGREGTRAPPRPLHGGCLLRLTLALKGG